MPCERERAAPSGASKRFAGRQNLAAGGIHFRRGGKREGAPAGPCPVGYKRNKNAELSKRALDILAGLDWQ